MFEVSAGRSNVVGKLGVGPVNLELRRMFWATGVVGRLLPRVGVSCGRKFEDARGREGQGLKRVRMQIFEVWQEQ